MYDSKGQQAFCKEWQTQVLPFNAQWNEKTQNCCVWKYINDLRVLYKTCTIQTLDRYVNIL